MDEGFAFALAAIVPVSASLWWIFQVQRASGASSEIRYCVARNLLTFGIVSVAAGAVLGAAAYGSSFGFWALAIFLSGLFSIPAAAVLGLGNLILLKRLGAIPSPTKDS
ncbi:hypothetical protein ACUXST_001618 [Sphingomonas sp. F9_3S_D5_B_2]